MGELASEGQGSAPEPASEVRSPRPRRRRPAPGGEVRGRKLHLPDEIHDRLRLLAFQRRTTASAVAAELLDRALPRFVIQREG